MSASVDADCAFGTGGKSLKDEETLSKLGLTKGSKLFFKDLGPQVGYATVSVTCFVVSKMKEKC